MARASPRGDRPGASDEAWSRRVGGVRGNTSGACGACISDLATSAQYAGLYWSHFQAALDWDDAEMWLEGAVQSGWSVSQMRTARGDTRGVAGPRPRRGVQCRRGGRGLRGPLAIAAGLQPNLTESGARRGRGRAPRREAGGERVSSSGEGTKSRGGARARSAGRPFDDLADLPADLAEAFEAFKLAILRHKTEGWSRISAADILASLEALQELVRAPADDASPF